MLVPLLGFAGFVIDVGYAYYTQRALQASADAAALAGAQELPDPSLAVTVALDYGATETGRNWRDNVELVSESITTKCIESIPRCQPVNAVVVDEKARVDTLFARVLGIDDFEVHARSTACSPCGYKPLDIMLVLDRTWSMCMTHNGNWDPSCTDLKNAKAGLKTFLEFLAPSQQWVGFAVFPPAPNVSSRCSTPQQSSYHSQSSKYTVVSLAQDYLDGNGDLNPSSDLVSTIDCQKGGGFTAYANAIESAQAELDAKGRSDIQDVIVFFSDGAANTGPGYYPKSSPYRKQPCHQGVWSAGSAKAKGTLIYSIGYDLDAEGGGANECKEESPLGPDETPAITAYQALEQIATDSGKFYNQPSADELKTIYGDIAADLAEGTSALIDNSIE